MTIAELYIRAVDRERWKQGLSMNDIKESLNVTPNAAYKIVQRGNCRLSTFIRYCDAVGIAVQLIGPDGHPILVGQQNVSNKSKGGNGD